MADGNVFNDFDAIVCLSTISLLHPGSIFRDFRQILNDVTAVEADVFQFPIAKLTEGEKICLAFVTRDRGGNPAVDEAADARHPSGSNTAYASWTTP